MLCLAQLQYNYWIVMPKTSYTSDLLYGLAGDVHHNIKTKFASELNANKKCDIKIYLLIMTTFGPDVVQRS